MKRVDEYVVIEAESREEIMTKVTNYVKQRDGFELLGGVSITSTTLGKVIYAQALVKYTN